MKYIKNEILLDYEGKYIEFSKDGTVRDEGAYISDMLEAFARAYIPNQALKLPIGEIVELQNAILAIKKAEGKDLIILEDSHFDIVKKVVVPQAEGSVIAGRIAPAIDRILENASSSIEHKEPIPIKKKA